MQLGVFTQWIKADSIEELANRVRDLDLQCVVLDSFPGLQIDLDQPSQEDCRRIAQAFAAAGVQIAAVGGYDNLVHPDPAQRERIHRRFRGLLRLCQGIGSPMLCSEAGTYHPTQAWEWDPANSTEGAYQSLLQVMRTLVGEAEKHGVIIGLEPYVMTVMESPERAARLMADLNSRYARLVCDPAGMLNRVTLEEQETFLPAAFAAISPYIGLLHVEDCRPDPNGHFLWLPAGQGLLNYPLFMDLVLRSGYDGPFILEHLSEAQLPAARNYVLQHWQQAQQRAEVVR